MLFPPCQCVHVSNCMHISVCKQLHAHFCLQPRGRGAAVQTGGALGCTPCAMCHVLRTVLPMSLYHTTIPACHMWWTVATLPEFPSPSPLVLSASRRQDLA